MAAADYWLCDRCNQKAFYDANLDYDDQKHTRRSDGRLLPARCGDAQVLCEDCAREYEVIIVKREARSDAK
jgi:hypothetical protein